MKVKGPSTFVVANPVEKPFQEGNLSSSDVHWFIVSSRFQALTTHELMLYLKNKKICFIRNNCPFTTKFNLKKLEKAYKSIFQTCQMTILFCFVCRR